MRRRTVSVSANLQMQSSRLVRSRVPEREAHSRRWADRSSAPAMTVQPSTPAQ